MFSKSKDDEYYQEDGGENKNDKLAQQLRRRNLKNQNQQLREIKVKHMNILRRNVNDFNTFMKGQRVNNQHNKEHLPYINNHQDYNTLIQRDQAILDQIHSQDFQQQEDTNNNYRFKHIDQQENQLIDSIQKSMRFKEYDEEQDYQE